MKGRQVTMIWWTEWVSAFCISLTFFLHTVSIHWTLFHCSPNNCFCNNTAGNGKPIRNYSSSFWKIFSKARLNIITDIDNEYNDDSKYETISSVICCDFNTIHIKVNEQELRREKYANFQKPTKKFNVFLNYKVCCLHQDSIESYRKQKCFNQKFRSFLIFMTFWEKSQNRNTLILFLKRKETIFQSISCGFLFD